MQTEKSMPPAATVTQLAPGRSSSLQSFDAGQRGGSMPSRQSASGRSTPGTGPGSESAEHV